MLFKMIKQFSEPGLACLFSFENMLLYCGPINQEVLSTLSVILTVNRRQMTYCQKLD